MANPAIPAITSVRPTPVDRAGLIHRLRLTGVAAGYALTMPPALALAILTILCFPLGLTIVGLVLPLAVVPATAALTRLHRAVSGALLGERITPAYADTAGRPVFERLFTWLRDNARWRDFSLLCYSATGGFIMALLPVALLTAPLAYAILLIVDGGLLWGMLLGLLGGPALLVWWLVTPPLVWARAVAEASILGRRDVNRLERRVRQVERSRAEAVDHNAVEIRRIERDLHDGAQARIAAVAMNVGLAEKLLHSDPQTAAALLREARDTSAGALEDLRSVVRGIHPPVLADRGLAGGIESLALAVPLPVTVAVGALPPLPPPVESAAYFTVAECLTNTIKYASASRIWISGEYDGERLRLWVGDDGQGGADPGGSGLSGLARRLAAFDGALAVDSPAGGPTVVTLELPCEPS